MSAGSRPPISRARFVLGHRLERHRQPLVAACPIEQGAQERLRGRFLTPEAQQREHGGRARRPQQLVEQHRTVGVGPLQVVDAHDERLAIRETREQVAQRLERTPPQTRQIAAVRFLIPPPVGHGSHLQQHWEHARQRRHVGGHQRLDILARHRREMAAQIVDDPVERLVWHRLVFVAPAGEHDHAGLRTDLAEKAPDQRALADP